MHLKTANVSNQKALFSLDSVSKVFVQADELFKLNIVVGLNGGQIVKFKIN